MRKYARKAQEKRGTRTIGYGRVGQHRKTGQRAGRGKTTQWKKSMYSYYLKQKELGFPDPDWIIGKKGFNRPQDMVRLSKVNAINVRDLDAKIDFYSQQNVATKTGSTYSIDLNILNIQKLLGRGDISKKVNITVSKASRRAINKIEAAGGKITLLSKAE
jgi:large subunit ribosomal protein L15